MGKSRRRGWRRRNEAEGEEEEKYATNDDHFCNGRLSALGLGQGTKSHKVLPSATYDGTPKAKRG